jgi:hypothetical protein
MKLWVKSLLFISAYTPLLLIFILRYIDFHSREFWIYFLALVLVNLIWLPVFKITRGHAVDTFMIEKSINRSGDALDYIIAYIIVFLGFQFEKWQDMASIFILLVVIFFVYVHSNLIFVNPLLNFFGFTIHDVESEDGGSLVVISKRFRLPHNGPIKVKYMSDNIYMEVVQDDGGT